MTIDNSSDNALKDVKNEKPLNELLTSSMVDIYIGPDSTHWPIHERLLCYYSTFFRKIFYDNSKTSRPGSNKSYGLPEDDDIPFELVVGWLYSRAVRPPRSEKDIGPLLDLYLLAVKLEIDKLQEDVVECVREWYHTSSTYPGLRRVQYIYAETNEDNAMREMMVSSIARQLTTSALIPTHWAKALQRNGQLAVDIIRSIQQWHIEERSIPDARDASADRGRLTKSAFSAVEDRETSLETTGTADTNLGVQSMGSVASEAEGEGTEVEGEPKGQAVKNGEVRPPKLPEWRTTPSKKSGELRASGSSQKYRWPAFFSRPEFFFLFVAWAFYLIYNAVVWGRT